MLRNPFSRENRGPGRNGREPARAWKPAAAGLLLALAVTSGAARAEVEVPPPGPGPHVVLLHGLIRTSKSMSKLADALTAAGYRVCNVSYPSRHHSIEVLAAEYVAPDVSRCFAGSDAPIDFVTHSMGGIIVRQLAALQAVPSLGRVVMLGPPNGGSEIVDELGNWWLFGVINGPAGRELGTSAVSTPRRLGPATFEVGIIAGGKPRNWLLSRYVPGQNDGKVSVANAALEGMKDFVVIPANHTLMMRDREAIEQTLRFLRDGSFAQHPVAVATASAS